MAVTRSMVMLGGRGGGVGWTWTWAADCEIEGDEL